jgi:tetratricopeptide (TPR) repeat protein
MEKSNKSFSEARLLAGLTAIVCVAVLAVHWPVLSAKAISVDDDQYLIGNMLVQNPGWASAKRFLTEVLEPSAVGGYYQPLAMISLMGDCALGAGVDNLMPFHRTSLILHATNTALVVMLLYLLFGRVWPAIGIGLLFGLHPMTVETIAWVSERKTLVAAFFAFLSLNFYVCYARGKSWKFYTACLLTYVLALMSKPITVPLPAVMLLLDYWPLRRLNRKAILEKIPFFALAVAGAIIAYISQTRTAGSTPPTEYGVERIPLTLCHNIVFYLCKIFWPANLSSFYPFPSPLALTKPIVAAGVIGTIILIPLLIISLRWTRAALTGWLIFFIAALPTMQIIGFSNVIASDKFAYIPSIGLLLVLTAFLCRLCSRGKVFLRCLLVLVIVLISAGAEATATRAYIPHWRSTLTLCDYMLRQTPGEPQVLNLRGGAFQKEGNLDEAVHNYVAALEKRPYFVDARNNLALTLKLQGRVNEAIDQYRISLQFEPNNGEVHYNLGNALQTLGKFDEAISHYKQALKIKRGHVQTQLNLANALAAQGKYDEALGYYHKIVNIRPLEAIIRRNIGVTLEVQGKLNEAVIEYRKALQIKPDDVELHLKIGDLLASQGKLDEAIGHFSQAARLQPNNAEAHYNMGVALAMTDKPREAIEYLKQAMRLKPSWSEPAIWLARILAACPDPGVRDPNGAVEISLRAAESTKYEDPDVLEILAFSYAAAARFEEAVKTAQQALALAEARRDDELANHLRDMIEQYKNQSELKVENGREVK